MTWRRFLFAAAAAFSLSSPVTLPAQEPPANEPPAGKPADVGDEMRALRGQVDRQTLQIEVLAREISQLRRRLESGPEAASSAAAPIPDNAPAPHGEPSPPAAASPPPNPALAAEIPKAEPTGGGVKHIVAKGETLTSIAKQYNLAVAVLQKANKIQDGRKLQIGQVLSIPNAAEAAPQKKETP